MIPDAVLDAAVERGVITAAQAAALRALAATPADGPVVASDRTDDEQLRFVSGFADIFVTIGIALFLGALGYLVALPTGLGAGFATVAVAAWLLAEFFTRRRRMALPSIALLVAFAGNAVAAGLTALDTALSPAAAGLARRWPSLAGESGLVLLLVGLTAAGLAGLHYWRFRVPIAIAAVMAILLLAALGLLRLLAPDTPLVVDYGLAFLWGVLTFALAMRFDLSDRGRLTRRADIAFWLHLLAAPLIVHSLVHGLAPDVAFQPTPSAALVVLAAFVPLGLLAVAIDRRAILVSGLVYVGIAFGSLLRNSGHADAGLILPTVALTLGAFILLLSAGWVPLRRVILSYLPTALARRLPQPMVASPS